MPGITIAVRELDGMTHPFARSVHVMPDIVIRPAWRCSAMVEGNASAGYSPVSVLSRMDIQRQVEILITIDQKSKRSWQASLAKRLASQPVLRCHSICSGEVCRPYTERDSFQSQICTLSHAPARHRTADTWNECTVRHYLQATSAHNLETTTETGLPQGCWDQPS